MATKRKTFCVETHTARWPGSEEDRSVAKSCGFTYAQAERVARRALMVRGARVSHVVSAGGRVAASCIRHSPASFVNPGRVECRTTHHRYITSRLAESIEGDPMAFLRRR